MFLSRFFGRETDPSESARALAQRGAELRRQAFKAKRDAKTAALRADIAAGRIARLGWKQ